VRDYVKGLRCVDGGGDTYTHDLGRIFCLHGLRIHTNIYVVQRRSMYGRKESMDWEGCLIGSTLMTIRDVTTKPQKVS